ncbi:unnamed protein product [Arctia plantaginis]|uniref:apyrase n=1 Tax=Arctia plantaginis TaxID=874455 RepID=A0A8S1AF48_ARCPL|nr:unnamed protein product [Arctia plantaginis]
MQSLMVWYVILLVSSVCAQNNGLFELNIVHYNDFHARFDEVSPNGAACNPTIAPCIGGFARLYTAVMNTFKVEPDSLLLNAGDNFQGTIWYNFYRWNATQHFMNLLPHDAHVLGNHEFDNGLEGLLPYLEHLKAPMLGTNVNTIREPTMSAYIKKHIIVKRRGRNIGIIGALLRKFTGSKGQLVIEDELEAVNREAAILTEKGVDIIILLTHMGFNSDLALAARVSSTVDIIVGGHTNTLLYNGETPNGETPQGRYPTIVQQVSGHRIAVVQASCFTRFLGNIKFFINDKGIVERWAGFPIYLNSSIVQDPNILRELALWRQQVEAVAKEVLGVSSVTLSRSSCWGGECSLGSWVCDGFLDELLWMRQNTSHSNDVYVCLLSVGGLKMQIDPGNVTTESLLMVLPYENLLQVYDIKGQYLQEALELAVGVPWTHTFASKHILQIGGLRIVVNASKPVGSRVTATARCTDCGGSGYLPLDPNKTYKVVSWNYIGDGRGGFTMLAKHRENVENLGVDYVLLQRYLRRQQKVAKDLDGRIQIVY